MALFESLLTAAGSLASGLLGQSAADDAAGYTGQAARVGAKASKKAGKVLAKGYKQAGKRGVKTLAQGFGFLQPYAEAGAGGTDLLADLLGVNGAEAQSAAYDLYQQSPGFQAALDTGLAAVEQSAVGAGNYHSGNTMKELFQVGERARLADFYNWQNQLASLSGQGLTAAGQQVGLQTNIANLKSNAALGQAQARAGGILGAANAQTAGLQNAGILGLYGQGSLANSIGNVAGSLAGPLSSYLSPIQSGPLSVI